MSGLERFFAMLRHRIYVVLHLVLRMMLCSAEVPCCRGEGAHRLHYCHGRRLGLCDTDPQRLTKFLRRHLLLAYNGICSDIAAKKPLSEFSIAKQIQPKRSHDSYSDAVILKPTYGEQASIWRSFFEREV